MSKKSKQVSKSRTSIPRHPRSDVFAPRWLVLLRAFTDALTDVLDEVERLVVQLGRIPLLFRRGSFLAAGAWALWFTFFGNPHVPKLLAGLMDTARHLLTASGH